jgi:hypothetical protein
MKNELNTLFEQNLTMVHMESKLDACEICNSLVQKNKIENKLFLFTQATQTTIDQFLVSRNLKS